MVMLGLGHCLSRRITVPGKTRSKHHEMLRLIIFISYLLSPPEIPNRIFFIRIKIVGVNIISSEKSPMLPLKQNKGVTGRERSIYTITQI